MSFQTRVEAQPGIGNEGGRASNNPLSSVLGTFLADASGVRCGGFAWGSGSTASSSNLTGVAPTGFVMNSLQAFITTWKGKSSLVIPQGVPVTMFDRGDFYVKALYNDAAVDQKVFANLFNGKILTAAAGATPANPSGTTGTITASVATNVLTPTAGSVYLAPGMLVTGPGIPADTYIEAQLTGSAGATSAATYQLTTYPGTVASGTLTVTSGDGVGGFTGTASFATNVMTVTATTNGTLAVGQRITSAGVAAGTVISSLGTGTGGTGTYNLSTSPGTITAQAVTASAWVETPFFVKSAGNLGDIIKIGVKN